MADASSSSDTSTFSILRKLSKVMFMQKLNPLWAYIPGVLSLRDGMKNLLRERKGLNVFAAAAISTAKNVECLGVADIFSDISAANDRGKKVVIDARLY